MRALILLLLFSGQVMASNHGHHEHKAAEAGKRSFTIVNYQYESSRQWLPGMIAAYEGEEIEITLVNDTPSGVHGFAIKDFGVQVNVLKGNPQKVTFTAGKPGIYPIHCHLHPAHVGGQLLILPKPQP
jgi:heme/copper-type cytochrome/quinol oxidase subunit 2